MQTQSGRDHLFISYASEDAPFARWLALKLVSEGYAVWLDQLKLLGGESYPHDIDDAIKNRTFRLLFVTSHASVDKRNPTKERTLALNLSSERDEDFLIPLNLSGLKPSELPWMTSDLTFIPFHQSWADGLSQLLAKLQQVSAPRVLDGVGRSLAAATFLPDASSPLQEETAYANCFSFTRIPTRLNQYQVQPAVGTSREQEMLANWPSHRISDDTRLAFWPPDPSLGLACVSKASVLWGEGVRLCGVDTLDVVSRLLSLSLRVLCLRRGLRCNAEGSMYHFPFRLLPNDNLRFVSYTGEKTFVKVASDRKFGSARFRYNLGFGFDIRRGLFEPFVAVLGLRLRVSPAGGSPLTGRGINARRKAICKDWWNHDWLLRQFAVMTFLGGDDGEATIGPIEGEHVVFNTCPKQLLIPMPPSTPCGFGTDGQSTPAEDVTASDGRTGADGGEA